MPTFRAGTVVVSVPATSANLGPGFDSLGLALGLRDRIHAEIIDGPLEITVAGSGAESVPLSADHLVHRAMQRAFDAMGCGAPGVRLHCDNVIPHGRGLGSSSAAIVSGIVAARALVAGGSLVMDDDAVLQLAAGIEGHPDNVAPALLGGFTIAYPDGERYGVAQATVDPRIRVVVFVPPKPVETRTSRGLLPTVVPHADAALNAGRAALLVTAMNRQPELLLAATEDRLHQDYREAAMPESLALVRRLRADGVPAVISGAGPSVLAFGDDGNHTELVAVAPDGWEAHELAVDHDGARVEVT
jgi:homoserine kinase